jgi:hypothetical protein
MEVYYLCDNQGDMEGHKFYLNEVEAAKDCRKAAYVMSIRVPMGTKQVYCIRNKQGRLLGWYTDPSDVQVIPVS